MLDLNLPNREYRIDLLECRFYIRHLFRYSPGLVPMKSVNFSFRFFFQSFQLTISSNSIPKSKHNWSNSSSAEVKDEYYEKEQMIYLTY